MRVRLMLLIVVLAAMVGCSSDGAKSPEISSSDAYLAIVNWEIGQIGEVAPPSTDDSLPIVYVASEEGNTIDAGTQAKVVQGTVDTAKVRFTDVREDAIDTDIDGAPIKDDGVMLVVAKIDSKGKSRLEVPITVYRTEADQQLTTLTLLATADGVQVTAATPRSSG